MLCLDNILFFFEHAVDVPFVRIFYEIIFRDCFYKCEGRILKILFCLANYEGKSNFSFFFSFDDISLKKNLFFRNIRHFIFMKYHEE